jgi:hypothetical protein
MPARKKIEGLRGIDRAIKQIGGVAENLNERIQEVAVAIVEHANGAGNGDMSRALTLCKTVSRYRTLNVAYLIGWFRYFGNANINLKADDGAGKVSLISKDSKAYRGGFDVDGARANNWQDAFDDKGNRSTWYSGPAPADFQPMTVGDLANRMHNFVKNTTKLLTDTKEVKGKEVPLVELSEGDQRQVEHAMAFIDRIANTLARHEEVAKLERELQKTKEEATSDEAVIDVLAPQEKAVA